MKVLILCNDFPPLNSIGAQRPFSWFTYLKKYGIDPTIITKNWEGKIASRKDVVKSAQQTGTNEEVNEKGRVIRVPNRIIPPEKMLVKYGEHGRVVWRKMLTLIYKSLSFISLAFDKHSTIYFRADELLKKEKFDAILITGEPFILFRYGFLLSKKYNIPWVADFRDGWRLNHVTSLQKNILSKLLRWWEFRFEKKFVRSAAFVISVDPSLAKRLGDLHHKPFEIIYNGFDSFFSYPAGFTAQPGKLVLTHTGTLTPGQRAEFLLQAIKELDMEKKITPNDLVVKFIGIEYLPDQHRRIINFDPAVTPYIITTPRLPREKAQLENALADLFVSPTEETSVGIFAKTYDYLSMKKPIMVIPDDKSILSELVLKLKAGYIFSEVEELKKFLLQNILQKKSGQLNNGIKLNEEAALFYTREKQTQALAETLKRRIKA